MKHGSSKYVVKKLFMYQPMKFIEPDLYEVIFIFFKQAKTELVTTHDIRNATSGNSYMIIILISTHNINATIRKAVLNVLIYIIIISIH